MSKTAYKIKVMQAFEDGKDIQSFYSRGSLREWMPAKTPIWDWSVYNYRIKPEPKVIYVNEYGDCTNSGFTDKDAANKAYCKSHGNRAAVKYIEVID